MWSSKEVLFISIATGFVFCFATIYVQNAVTKYVTRQVEEKAGANPLIGMGLASRPQQRQNVQQSGVSGVTAHANVSELPSVAAHANVSELPSAPPGSGSRWTALPT